MIKFKIVTLILFLFLFNSNLISKRSIPDDYFSYPVNIKWNTGNTGTGVFVSINDAIYLLTAKHVLYDLKSNTFLGDTITFYSYIDENNESSKFVAVLDASVLADSSYVKSSSTVDMALIKIGDIDLNNKFYLIPTIYNTIPKKAIKTTSENRFVGYSDALIGNDVYLLGYPVSIGMRQSPQIDYDKPLIKKGIISGKNDQLKTIILDCSVYFGNSGGPVFQLEEVSLGSFEFRLIGIVVEYIPYVEEWINVKQKYKNINISNSGYSVVIPCDDILSIVK